MLHEHFLKKQKYEEENGVKMSFVHNGQVSRHGIIQVTKAASDGLNSFLL